VTARFRRDITLTQPRKIVVAIATALASGCKLEEPALPFTGTSSLGTSTGGTPGITSSPPPPSSGTTTQNGVSAPTIEGPLPGHSFTDPQPTLSVRNASADDGSRLSYDFQVASDDGFRGLAAETQGHAEGSGTTSWRVTAALAPARYYWRARAVGSRGPGPYSPISDFFVGTTAGPPPPSPPGAGEIFDPLTNGRSVGDQRGGRFTSAGWQVTSRGDFIRYVVPTIQSGYVEWDNVGLAPTNPAHDLYTLFGMWDPSRGPYRENPYRVHVRKLDTQGHNPPYLRLRWISGGEEHNEGYDFLDWIPNRAYHWRVEWGPAGSGNEARVLLDGRVVIRSGYGPAYRPEQHWIEMGVEERAESIVGVTFRNVRIGRR
jgi:hypothetical protein